MCKKAALFLLMMGIQGGVFAASVTLRNATADDRVMQAHGAATVVEVLVPANSEVAVEVGEAWFDRGDCIYAFGIGFAVMLPFLAYGGFKRVFREAE